MNNEKDNEFSMCRFDAISTTARSNLIAHIQRHEFLFLVSPILIIKRGKFIQELQDNYADLVLLGGTVYHCTNTYMSDIDRIINDPVIKKSNP